MYVGRFFLFLWEALFSNLGTKLGRKEPYGKIKTILIQFFIGITNM
jgi:hypothetical protein